MTTIFEKKKNPMHHSFMPPYRGGCFLPAITYIFRPPHRFCKFSLIFFFFNRFRWNLLRVIFEIWNIQKKQKKKIFGTVNPLLCPRKSRSLFGNFKKLQKFENYQKIQFLTSNFSLWPYKCHLSSFWSLSVQLWGILSIYREK